MTAPLYAGESRNEYRPEGPRVSSPEEAAAIARGLLADPSREQFVGIYLNSRGVAIHSEVLAVGTADAVLLHPREVFRPGILHGAVGVVIVHNHPTGDPAPSAEDWRLTRRLRNGGEALGIPLMDHVVIGQGFVSMRSGAEWGAGP